MTSAGTMAAARQRRARWGLRIVDTDDGPVLVVSPDNAHTIAASVRVLLGARPEFAGPDRPLLALLDALLELADRPRTTPADTRPGSAPGTTPVGPGVELVSTTEAGRLYGISPRAIRKRITQGRIPRAAKVAGTWMIPADVLPEPDPEHP